MKFAYCYAGGNMPAIKEFDIESTADVDVGEVVCTSNGVIDGTVKGGKLLGVCMETHTGKEDILNARSNGTKIRVCVTDGVYETDAMKLTAKDGCSENTFECESTGLSDACVGGVLVLMEKAEDSTNTDKIGAVRKITACTGNDDSAYISVENGGIPCKGDVYALIPPLAAALVLDTSKKGYSLNNLYTDVELRCVGFDVDRAKVYVKLLNTIFA